MIQHDPLQKMRLKMCVNCYVNTYSYLTVHLQIEQQVNIFIQNVVRSSIVSFISFHQLQWRNWLAHGTYNTVSETCRGCEFEPHLEYHFYAL
jgi:hypothetical protein